MTVAKIDRTSAAYLSPTPLGVALVLSAVLVLAGCGDDDSADGEAFTDSDALGIVEEYYAASGTGDVMAVAAMFVDDPALAGKADLDEHLTFLAWDAAQGTELVDRSCRTDGEAETGGFVVVCDYDNLQYLHRVVGAPATPITETIVVTAEGIAEVDASYHDPLFPATDAFERWMNTNHSDEAAATFCCGEDGSVEDARADGELRRQYADLWAEHLEASGCTYADVGC